MSKNGTATETAVKPGNGNGKLAPQDVERAFGRDAYHKIEILRDGTIREAPRNGDAGEDTVTRTLKTERTWY
jgi:hypothetical protein